AFAEYEKALKCAKVSTNYLLTKREDSFQVTRETLSRLFKVRPEAVFLAHPANPTGRLVPKDILLELALECHRRNIWLIIDEAFIDFSENATTLLPYVGQYPKLIVLRSLTKIFALPGLRLAYLAAAPHIVDKLKANLEPWSLSSPAISAGHFCLKQTSFIEKSRYEVNRLKSLLINCLAQTNLGHVFPSEANYLLWQLTPSCDYRQLLDALFQQKILLRNAFNFVGLREGYLRLAVRPEADLNHLSQALKQFKGTHPPDKY
ncbi:MAG: pyridoxal phosphate-dependent aminotransferase, partial [Candidatus Adiutrix sp.]